MTENDEKSFLVYSEIPLLSVTASNVSKYDMASLLQPFA